MKHQSTWLSRLVLSVRRSFYKCNSRSSIKENSGSYTHKQALKKAVIVVTSILLAIFMPVIAIVSFFSGNISVDTAGLSSKIEAQMTVEKKAKVEKAENLSNKLKAS